MNSSRPFNTPPQRPEFDPYQNIGRGRGAFHRLQYLFLIAALALLAKVGWSLWHLATPRPIAQPNYKTGNVPLPGDEYPMYYDSEVYPGVPEPTGPVESPSDRFNDEGSVRRPAVVATPSPGALDWAKSRQRATVAEAHTVQQLCEEWQSEMSRWTTTVVPLLKNADGKLLAADPETVRNFRAIYEPQRSGQEECDKVVRIVADLTDHAAEALNDPQNDYLPVEDVSTRLAELAEQARFAGTEYRNANEQIAFLLDAARKAAKPAEQTLAAAIDVQKQADQEAAIAAARERMDAAQRQADEQIAAAQAEAVRVAGEVEAQRIMAEAGAAQVRQQTEAKRLQAEAEKQARTAAMQRDLGEIRRYLAPFIAPGYAQPNGYHNAQGGEEGPMSWSRIASSNALKPTREGMEQLMRYATVSNDRPHGNFPQYSGGDYGWTQTNKDYVKRAQELLKQHGEAMVEAGLLAK